jgi:cell wall-associated NlpC family hydrolase
LRRGNPNVLRPTVACEVPEQFQISTLTSNFITFTGSLWNLYGMYATPPYTELFIRDVPGAAAPEFRWRWAPLCKLGNRLALPWTPHPTVHTLHAREVIRYDVDATDNEKYTYFWAPPGSYGTVQTGISVGKYLAPGYVDAPGIDQFGFNDLQPQFNMYRISASADPANDDSKKTRSLWVPQIKALTQWLADTMLHNEDLLEGTVQCRLRPDLIVGDYVDIPEEGTRLYIQQVSHSLTFGAKPAVSTALNLARGQRLGDRDVPTPGSYKYTSGAEIPGGSKTGTVPSEAGAQTADQAAPATSAAAPGGSPGSAPAPPFLGEAEAAAVVRLLGSLVGVADYALGRRNIDKGSDVRATFAAITKPGPQNPAGDQGGGIDCSELVEWGLRFGAGKRLPAPAQNQYNMTPRVPFEQLQPGDVVFFGGTTGGDISGSNITHSGFYIGGGQMINAQDFGQKVKVADLASGYWRQHFVSGGRVFTPPAPGGAGGVENQH